MTGFKTPAATVRKGLRTQMALVLRDAHNQMVRDYLRRGGTFRRTKRTRTWAGAYGTKMRGGGKYEWVRNPTRWLRVGDGALVASWRVRPIEFRGVRMIGRIASISPYARIHEEGGDTGRGHAVHLRKRSYIEPMVRDNRRRWKAILGHGVVVELRSKH
jgi:hypothetical protein